MLNFHIITIFPEIFESYFNESIIKRAQNDKKISIKVYNLRDWTSDRHKTVDDTPYGGGAGMLMKVEPFYLALQDIKKKLKGKTKTVLFSARGKRWKQAKAKKFAKLDNIIMLCPRYEGIDKRILHFVDEEISLGDYVLTGGELGAMVLVDSVSRLIPGVLGNTESAKDESHSIEGVLEYPQYTKPEVFKAGGKEYKVPKVLLSGHHQKIKDWREKNKKKI